MAKRIIRPGSAISGAIEVPGDKSISHRYAILAALAEGRSDIRNYPRAGDCRSTLDCLHRLGVRIDSEDGRVVIHGAGLRGWRASRRSLDAGNSGTTMRLLSGALSGQTFSSKLTGDRSLLRRPMRRIVEPLRLMGAEIRAARDEYPPLAIRGGALRPIEYEMPFPSAQVKSAILLAGLFADGWTSIIEPHHTRDHTEIALRQFGAAIEVRHSGVRVRGGTTLLPQSLHVPGDISSAAFLIGAALVAPGSRILLRSVGLNPRRAAFLDVLASWGAPISLAGVKEEAGELSGEIAVHHGPPLTGGVIEGRQIPLLMDELPLLAALGPYTLHGVEFRGAEELRRKESDRIAALSAGLRRLGASVTELDGGLRVEGAAAGPLRGARLESAGDHRIAMALAVAALGARGESMLRGAECVRISFPDFWDALERLRCPENAAALQS